MLVYVWTVASCVKCGLRVCADVSVMRFEGTPSARYGAHLAWRQPGNRAIYAPACEVVHIHLLTKFVDCHLTAKDRGAPGGGPRSDDARGPSWGLGHGTVTNTTGGS